MRLRRVRPGEWLAGAAGALLIVSLFVTWYRLPSGGTPYAPLPGGHGLGTGWQAFAVTDVVLTVLGAVGLVLLVAQAACRSPALPASLSVLTVLAGVAAIVIVVIQLLTPPAIATPGVGAWLGLAGALGLLLGGWWSMATETVHGMPMPDVELRPAPPREG